MNAPPLIVQLADMYPFQSPGVDANAVAEAEAGAKRDHDHDHGPPAPSHHGAFPPPVFVSLPVRAPSARARPSFTPDPEDMDPGSKSPKPPALADSPTLLVVAGLIFIAIAATAHALRSRRGTEPDPLTILAGGVGTLLVLAAILLWMRRKVIRTGVHEELVEPGQN